MSYRSGSSGGRQLWRWVLLGHQHPEGDAAEEFVPIVVVFEVRSVHPALHHQILTVILLPQQQLHRNQRLNVPLLQAGGHEVRHKQLCHKNHLYFYAMVLSKDIRVTLSI